METNRLNGHKEHFSQGLNGHDTLLIDNPEYDFMGDNHISTSIETPMREDAFMLTDEDKREIIETHFKQIMLTLGLDLNDDSLSGTPKRISKLFVNELFKGLNPANKPGISVFENKFNYNQMLVEKNISVRSTCEHHFLPVTGKAHVAYISSGKVIGLSKLNRIVDYFARRPQIQERMTVQIAEELKQVLETEDIAVVVEAKHHCVSTRGIEDDSSTTLTASYNGKFKDERTREEFLRYISLDLRK
ncbi:MAG: GTP cyclohydrolase I FolE [Bacteroidales bacterium]|nr:GTP cyclohydrolase I FolE [Bacteroidales bacterium]